MNSCEFLKIAADRFADHIAISDSNGDITYKQLYSAVCSVAESDVFLNLETKLLRIFYILCYISYIMPFWITINAEIRSTHEGWLSTKQNQQKLKPF